jgi:acrylyl-CoA reductase (NADPH)
MNQHFRALIAEGNSKQYTVEFKELPMTSLPAGEVLVRVQYSSLNYKDGLAVTGRGKIIRKFPMVCGIDLAGKVLESSSSVFRPGDEVLAVGQNLSETVWGGYSQFARLPAEAVLPAVPGLSLRQAMAIGTAGLTAMLALQAMEHNGLRPGAREILVTGATGGVGSIAILLLAAGGYRVAAATGRPAFQAYLRDLGANTIVERAELAQAAPPLASERWAAGIDTVGGSTLASLLAATAACGSVAAVGLAGSSDLSTTVFPFILRNVSLLGINSVQAPKELRVRAWNRLAKQLPLAKLDALTRLEPLSKIKELANELLDGKLHGRIAIDVGA